MILWHAQKRLVHLREGLHDPLADRLGKDYSRLFSKAPFALHGGPKGTSARLTKWLARLADCVNRGSVEPEVVALILRYLDAPLLPDHSAHHEDLLLSAEPPLPFKGTSASQESVDHRQAQIQALFNEELIKRFEYESAERCFNLQCRGAPSSKQLEEVIRCFADTLEDYQARLDARDYVWDDSQQCLVPLTPARRDELRIQISDNLQPALMRALDSAATAACHDGLGSSRGLSLLANRRHDLENDCNSLLQQKTLVAEELQDLQEELELSCSTPSCFTEEHCSTPSCLTEEQSSCSSRTTPRKARSSFFRSLTRSRSAAAMT